jgi:hypothetical protein
MYLMLNEKFQYSDLEAPGCFSYPIMRPSMQSRDYLGKIMSNAVILKLWVFTVPSRVTLPAV